ncbi:MAG: ribosome small subunit-dependent GTPase A [Parasporobacterium sp.]|nr:ribosome small subunit-dependent GTPase A [Parasporobacterium sp.]
MNGQIVKAVSGFYYVKTNVGTVYECHAKGAFRNEDITPLVGDNVVFNVTEVAERKGIIKEIQPRKNFLVRPAVANVDQAMVVFAVRNPNPNLSILDRFLVLMKKQNIPTIIVFNKKDLAKTDDVKNLKKTYKKAGCKVFFVAAGAESSRNMFFLKWALKNKITVMAGPSGVGKSTLLNNITKLAGDEVAKVGELSEKIGRGKNTTRHNEMYNLGFGYRIIDTPGFTSLLVNESDYSKEELQNAFPEFDKYKGQCPFRDCLHDRERDCAVKTAVEKEEIPASRYNNYKAILSEIKASKKY